MENPWDMDWPRAELAPWENDWDVKHPAAEESAFKPTNVTPRQDWQRVAKEGDKLTAAKMILLGWFDRAFGTDPYGRTELKPATPAIGFGKDRGGIATIPESTGTGPLSGAYNAVGEFASGLTSPENVAAAGALGAVGKVESLGIGALGKLGVIGATDTVPSTAAAAKAATTGLFTAQMGKGTYDAASAAREVLSDPNATAADKTRALTALGLNAGFTGLAASGTKTLADIASESVPKKQVTEWLNAKAGEPLPTANAKANEIALKNFAASPEFTNFGSTPEPQPNILSEIGGLQQRPLAEATPEATPTIQSIEGMLGIGKQEPVEISALAKDERTAPEYKQRIAEEAAKRTAADKAMSVSFEPAQPAAETILADRLKQSQTQATGKESTKAPSLGDLVGQDVHFGEYSGKLIRDDEGNFVVLQSVTDGKPNMVEVPDTGKDPSVLAKDVGISPSIKMEPVLGRGIQDEVVPRETLDKAVRIEANDHPSIAASNPELLPQIVKDELAIDKDAYKGEKDPQNGGKPIPKTWTITRWEMEGYDGPPIVQIDKTAGPGLESQGSTSPDQLRAEGYSVPDYSKLSHGQYTAGDAAKLLGERKQNAVQKQVADEVSVRQSPDNGQAMGEGIRGGAEPAKEGFYQKEGEAVDDYKNRLAETISKRVAQSESSGVDVGARTAIKDAVRNATGVDVADISKSVPYRTVQEMEYLHDKVNDLLKAGRQSVKDNKAAYAEEQAAIAEDLANSQSEPWQTPEKRTSVGVRQPVGEKLADAVVNKVRSIANGAEKAGRSLLVRDVALDILDGGQNYSGPLSRRIGGAIDHDYNLEQNLKRDWIEPIKEVADRNKIDEKSLERVNIYATEQMQGGRERLIASGVKPELIDSINQTITPGELEYYKAVRSLFDEKLYPQVRDFMRDNYNVDVGKVENYWPYLRDFEKAPLDIPEPVQKIARGEEVGFDEMASWRNLENDFLPLRTTKTKQGFTVERLPEAEAAIKLTADVVDRHIRQVAHLLSHQRDLKMLGELARKDWFKEKYGDQGQKYVLNLLDTVSRDSDPANSRRNPLVDAAINNTSAAIIGLRVIGQLKHAPNAAFTVAHLGPKFAYDGLYEAMKTVGKFQQDTPQSLFLKRNFAEIYQRYGGETAIADIADRPWMKWTKVINDKSPAYLGRMRNKAFGVERALDSAIARATVIGAYMKELEAKGKSGSDYLDLPFDREAGRKALIESRRSVTSPLRKDTPQAISRGTLTGGNISAARAIFQFQQTMLRQAGYIKHDIWDNLRKQGLEGKATAMVGTLAVLSMLAAETQITNLNRQILGAEPKPGKEKGFGEEMAIEAVRRAPFAGNALALVNYKETGIPLVDSAIQGLGAIGTLAKGKDEFGRPLSKLEAKRTKADLAQLVGTLSGTPGAGPLSQYYKNKVLPQGR